MGFIMDKRTKGQALAEFALILIVLVGIIFLIVDSSRVLWAWVTVQNAARDGARFAITGRADCQTGGTTRLECITSTTKNALAGLPLNEDPGSIWEDDNYYRVEVWGVNADNQWELGNPGEPGRGIIVRTYYRVPIITPILRPIQSSFMMNGEVWLNNEQFNSLGGDSAGVGLPPPIPLTAVPTAGQTPTATPTDTPGPTPSATITPTITMTPSPTPCSTHFEGILVAGNGFANVTGDVGGNIILYDRGIPGTPPSGSPPVLGTAVLGAFDTHDCPGFVIASPLIPPLQANHLIEVRNNTDGTFDIRPVLPGTPTQTPSPTFTPSPTPAPSNTPTPTSSPTPASAYIVNSPSCSNGPGAQFTVQGYNWATNTTISLFWILADGTQSFQGNINAPHPASFQQTLTFNSVPNGVHKVRAIAGAVTRDAIFRVPCFNITPTPTTTPPTPTPAPADLIVVGAPVLISTPPIVEYQPLDFQITISNTGSVAVSEQFFTDLFLDPPDDAIYSDTISLFYSGGYQAVTNLDGMSSRTLTINVPIGFTGGLTVTRTVYGVVDSILQIDEANNFNNISIPPLYVANVTPAPSPTPSPTPDGTGAISGIVRAFIIDWVPQFRAKVFLVSGSTVVQGPILTGANGLYQFNGVPAGAFEVYACIDIDNQTYVGVRTGIVPTDPFADVFMLVDAAGCPYS
jgi:hypothetical protein